MRFDLRFGHPLTIAMAFVPLACALDGIAEAEVLSVQAKSFIAGVNLADASQFDSDAKSCEQAMAALVDCGMTLGENPADGLKSSGNFRLRSELSVNATCSANKIASWQFDPIKQDFGAEFVFLATSGDLIKPLKALPDLKGNVQVDKVTFSYRLRGRPNALGVDAMNKVKPRTCSYIWHEISGNFTCRDGKVVIAADITGSGFPSHRLWVQGKKVAEVPQGPFKNLWKCDSTDPISVK
jgi:hypothetical protein